MTATPRYCRSCSYDLRATTSPRCPECGRPFDPANPKSYAKRPRRTGLRRWSVRFALSLLILALALGASWYYLYRGYQREQAAIKTLSSIISARDFTSEPLGGRKLQYALGHAGFVLNRVRCIYIGYQRRHPSNLVPLQEFSCLETINIQCYVHDDEIRDISQCKTLTTLEILGSEHSLTDAALARLQSLPKLRILTLRRCDKITDAGIEHLHQIPTLREIKLEADSISPAALKSLQSALPAAKITEQ